MKKIFTTLALASSVVITAMAQTNPVPFAVANADFTFDGFEDGSSTDYPEFIRGWKGKAPFLNNPDPGAPAPVNNQSNGDFPLLSQGSDVYGTSFINEADRGISMRGNIMGSDAPLALAMSLSTMGSQTITINWTGIAISCYPSRTTAIQLQYRIGTQGDWINFSNNSLELDPSSDKAGKIVNFTASLPATAENQPIVQLRWMNFTRFEGYTTTVSNNLTNRGSVDAISIKATTKTPQPPVADFTVDNANPEAGNSVEFKDVSSGFPTSYYWDFGDGTFDSIKNPTHTYYSGGKYTVKLTATNSVGSHTVEKAGYMDVIGDGEPTVVQHTDAGSVIVYPNPTTGFFQIKTAPPLNSIYSTLTIADLTGKIIYSARAFDPAIQANLSAIESGLYFVKIEDQTNCFTGKLRVIN